MLYGPFTFGTLTTGQFIIPAGVHTAQITIQSGSCPINGVTFWAPQSFSIGGVDSKMVSMPGATITIGAMTMTGVGTRVNYAFV